MEKVSIQELEVHPNLIEISIPQKEIDKMKYLLEKIDQINPIGVVQVDGKKFIIDGLVRFAAAKSLNWKEMKVNFVDQKDETFIMHRCFSNHVSKRTYWNLAVELNLFMNHLVGKKRGKKRNIEEIMKYIDNIEEKKAESIVKDINLIAIEFYGLPFQKTTLGSLMYTYEKHKNASKELLDFKIFEKLDKGEIPISRAAELTKEYFGSKKEQGKNALTDVIEYSKKPINNDQNHKIYCHSNHDLSMIPKKSVNTVITSPGYFGKQAKYVNAEKNFNGTLHGNEKNIVDYIKKEVETYRSLKNILKDDGSLFVIIGDAFRGDNNCVPERLVVDMLNDGWYCNSHMLWLKSNQKPQNIKGRLQPAGEHVLHFTLSKNYKWREFIKWTNEPYKLDTTTGDGYVDGIKRPGYYVKKPIERFRTFIEEQMFEGIIKQNCFNVSEVKEFGNPIHPCPFPLNLALFLQLLTTEIGDVCADIYGGIGTVSHAAKLLHRQSISVDIDKVASNYAANRVDSCNDQIFTDAELSEVENLFKNIHDEKIQEAA